MTSPVHETSLHLIFQLGGEIFALNVSEIRAILALSAMTVVRPELPGLRGTLFLSGTTVPVIDIHEKFGLPAYTRSPDACIIVIERDGGRTEDLFGVVVDRVKEVTAQNLDEQAGAPQVVSLLGITAEIAADSRQVADDDQSLSETENAPARSQLHAP